MPSPIRQDHARWKRLKPLQIHLNPLLKGLNLFTTFHLPGRGITSPFHTIYIYIRTCTCKQQWISKTNQFLLVGHSGMIFSKKNTERSPESFIKQLGKKHMFSLLFFWSIKKIWHREKVRGVAPALGIHGIQIRNLLVHLFEFHPTGRVSHHAEKISFDRSIHDPGGGKKWWLISPAWTAAVGILGFCKRGFWGKSSDSPGLVRFCKYTICI